MHSPPKRAAADDTFAKLLRAHAAVRGGRPAFRHKDFGIWQTWTWAEVYEETRAIAQGLLRGSASNGATQSPSPAPIARGSIGR